VGLQYFTLSESLRSALEVANMDLRLFQNATALCDLTARKSFFPFFGLYFICFLLAIFSINGRLPTRDKFTRVLTTWCTNDVLDAFKMVAQG
jgi:hypothetical protein